MKFYNGKQIDIGNFDVNYHVNKSLPILHQCFSDLIFRVDNKKYKIKWEFDVNPTENNIIPLIHLIQGFQDLCFNV